MSKAEEKSLIAYPKKIEWVGNQWDGAPFDVNSEKRFGYQQGYHQAEKDVKDELSELFREFMMDCVNDSTDTHILHFVEVFNNKIKEIGNE